MSNHAPPPGRIRRTIMWSGFAILLACALTILGAIVLLIPATWVLPAFSMLLPGFVIVLLGRYPPEGEPIPRWRKANFYIGCLLVLASAAFVVLSARSMIPGVFMLVGFVGSVVGMGIILIGSHRPGGPDDDPMSPWAAMGMGGRR